MILLFLCCLQEPSPPPTTRPAVPEITVTATRWEEEPYQAPRSTTVITAEEMERKGARTVPEILREEAGITLQQTNLGGGSPILRGLMGNQVLVLVDGVRLNNATTRRGPNQYLNTIDPATIERIEVVRGISSVLYGSDAVGGVIQIFTKRRRSYEPGLRGGGAVAGRFDTAADARSGSLTLEGNLEDFGFAQVGSLRAFSDLRGGADAGHQDHTGYGPEGSLFGAWTLRLPDSRELSFTAQFNDQRDVPRTDRLEGGPGGPPQDLVNEFDPQRRELYALRFADREKGSIADETHWTLSLQRQREDQATRRIGSNNLDEGGYRDRTLGLGFQARRALGPIAGEIGHGVTWGAEIYLDDVLASRKRTNLATGEVTEIQPAFPNGADYRSLGVYLQDEVALTEKFDLRAGVRWSQFAFDADLPDPIGHVHGNFDEFTAALDAGCQVSEETRLVAGVAQGFRAPNLDDLTSFKITNQVVEDGPNPDVEPEIYRGFEVGARWRREGAAAALVYHFTQIRDLIARVPGTFMGQPVFVQDNVGRGFVEGIETEASTGLGEGFEAFGNAFWTVGLVTSGDNEPMRRIPPLSGAIGVRWEEPVRERFWGSLSLVWARKQHRLNPEDVTDIRIGPGGTEGYGVVHARGGWRVTPDADLFLALENVGDVDHRVHGSGIDGPGRNLVVGAEIRF